MLIFLWVPLWLVVGALIAPGVWLYHLPRMLRGKRAIERAVPDPDAVDQQ